MRLRVLAHAPRIGFRWNPVKNLGFSGIRVGWARAVETAL
jgi:hypothetical protein